MEQKNEKFIVYGRQPVIEALRSDYSVNSIWLARDLKGKVVGQIERVAKSKEVRVRKVDKNEIQKLSGPVVHQGVAAEMKPLTIKSEKILDSFLKEVENPFLLILDQVQDPHNTGAILRTAEISGVDAIILPEKGSAQLNATVAKTSAGALFHLNIFRVPYLESVIETLNGNGVLTGALMPGSENSMYQKDFKKPLAIIVGSEGPGVRKNIAALCSDRITIPQFGKIESLNASVATAVVLYEVVRQRQL
ncbi:MAG: 23S rRNA (guanosine(2251)-2'-O)-methyltransferase RlmB [Calditrichaeota bacterium]|nr:MAG: 23S rRNA (guanosine(2251)-2'-O)-methyltransferase RlmB [Calditrichota bacterium]MBL1205817.1 23S rRNA (guanosine(2251)-2'-O)-methyltransferase RlmB [Calditrichota bacterium]NOG45645.1 23S rRNA (guanosine(2251)-2'-O)-methyltransferase RlmB [Calditrichota bacterium]